MAHRGTLARRNAGTRVMHDRTASATNQHRGPLNGAGTWAETYARDPYAPARANGATYDDADDAQLRAGYGDRDAGREDADEGGRDLCAAVERHAMARDAFRRHALDDRLEGCRAVLTVIRDGSRALLLVAASFLVVVFVLGWLAV